MVDFYSRANLLITLYPKQNGTFHLEFDWTKKIAMDILWLLIQQDVLVAVLISGKKGICSVDQCCELADHIASRCPNLKLAGLMTIGAPGHDYSKGSNPDFEVVAIN